MIPAQRLFQTTGPKAVLLIRLVVGLVFLSEGLQKFLFPETLGVGRFEKIGTFAPELTAPFVGCVEVVCGSLLLAGFATRAAALPLLIVMLVAIASTKVPILLAQGFWKMAHEARTDFAMLMSLLFLVIVGAGPWSLDARILRRDRP